MARRSEWEELLAVQLTALQIEFKREQTLIPGRRFRFDFLVGQSLIAEVEGGTWRGGRHTTGAGFQKDCEKYNLAVEMGYRVLRFTSNMAPSGDAAQQIERIVRQTSSASVRGDLWTVQYVGVGQALRTLSVRLNAL